MPVIAWFSGTTVPLKLLSKVGGVLTDLDTAPTVQVINLKDDSEVLAPTLMVRLSAGTYRYLWDTSDSPQLTGRMRAIMRGESSALDVDDTYDFTLVKAAP